MNKNKAYARAFLGVLIFGIGFIGQSIPLSAAVILSDDFETLSPSVWTSAAATGGTESASGGVLSLTTVGTTSSFRATILSQNSSLNPFASALTFTLTGLSMSGSPGTGSNANDFYMLLGYQADSDNVKFSYPGTVTNGQQPGVLMLQILSTVSGYQLEITDAGSGAPLAATTFAISGMPTGLSWTVNGSGGSNAWSVTLNNATFTSGNVATENGTFTNFTLASITDSGTVDSRIALGAFNSGLVTAATSVTLDSITVTSPVPEPSTWALAGIGALFTGGMLRRRTLAAARTGF